MKLDLSPLDSMFLGPHAYPIQMSFRFENGVDEAWLSGGLNRLVDQWPVLSGCLRVEGDRAWIETLPSRKIRLSVESVARLPDPDAPGDLRALEVPFSTEAGAPLVDFRLVQGERGAWLTASLAHCLGDGYSFFLMLRNLARACHQEPIDSIRWDRTPLVPATSNFVRDETLVPRLGESRARFKDREFQWVLDRIPAETMKQRVLQAQAETVSLDGSQLRLSAHDWLSVDRWKKEVAAADPQTVTQYCTPVDFRRFRKAELGPAFFGNAIYLAKTTARVGEVQQATFGSLARQIRGSIRGATPEAIDSYLFNLHTSQQEVGLSEMHRWNLFQPVSPILVTNISSLPLSEIRLGRSSEDSEAASDGASNWQPPSLVRSVISFGGLSVVLPTGDGSTLIQSALYSGSRD